MAPRSGSPTRAFEPTPALEYNKQNYTPFHHQSNMLSFDTYANELPKAVHFQDPISGPFHRAHSIATDNVPLLPAVSSASTVPKQAFRIANPTPGIDITAYIENCRNLNEQLRQAHEAERRAWNIERSALKARIADLEFKVNKIKDPLRRSSIESPASVNHHVVRSDIRAMYQASNSSIHKPTTDSAIITTPPVWKGPESTPPTRVFQTEESTANHHLPSISEDEPLPSLSKQVSPTTVPESEPVPIEKVDSSLDGITLKSAALTSSFVTKITSPQFGSPAHSPSAKPTEVKPKDPKATLTIDAVSLLSPLDEKLKRHAGHTPMNFSQDVSNGTSALTTEISTPQPEKPIEPAPTTRPPLRPSENSDSYFSFNTDGDVSKPIAEETEKEVTMEDEDEFAPQYETTDDRPLQAPLMLDSSATTQAASNFLQKLDAKLEAVREMSPERRESFVTVSDAGDTSTTAAPFSQPVQPPAKEADDDMPKLRMRKSTNFGSAYGFNMPGRM